MCESSFSSYKCNKYFPDPLVHIYATYSSYFCTVGTAKLWRCWKWLLLLYHNKHKSYFYHYSINLMLKVEQQLLGQQASDSLVCIFKYHSIIYWILLFYYYLGYNSKCWVKLLCYFFQYGISSMHFYCWVSTGCTTCNYTNTWNSWTV